MAHEKFRARTFGKVGQGGKVFRVVLRRTNETVNTVVAVEDCTDAVTIEPVNKPVKRLEVMAPNAWRSWEPAIFCKASLMDFIPNMRSASEPSIVKIVSIIITMFV